MWRRQISAWVMLLSLVGWSVPAAADIVMYRLPNTNLVITLRGRYTSLPGGNASFMHPKLGKLTMSSTDVVERHRVADPEDLLNLRKTRIEDAESALKAGEFALKHGMVDEVYACAREALKYEPNHQAARNILDLQQKITSLDFGESEQEAQELRSTVRMSKMKIAMSPHFILLHDTPDEPDRESGRRVPRSQERLELLEQVYESFLLKFYSQGVALDIPQARLKVVLFNDERDYQRFATNLDPELSSAIGFWDPKTNISFFFDHGSSESFQAIGELLDDLQAQADEFKRVRDPRTKDAVRMVNTLKMLVEIDRENSDIEVVTHECTHQMAGNTGLFPRHILTPSWVHEGLATYFEAPSEASWSGIGAVNASRLRLYRALAEGDPEHSHVDFIVGDQIFDYAGNHMSVLHGYSQAWALTHFLVENHFTEFMEFYKRLGEMPPDISFDAEVLTTLFDDVFETDRDQLNLDYHSYMRGLKTDLEAILED